MSSETIPYLRSDHLPDWTKQKVFFTIAPDGSVALGPDLNLDDLRNAETWTLRVMRQMIDTVLAERDHERE